MKDIYKLKLHEITDIEVCSDSNTATSYWSVMRVPGGWIYQIWDTEKQDYVRGLFIPFNNEFQIVEP